MIFLQCTHVILHTRMMIFLNALNIPQSTDGIPPPPQSTDDIPPVHCTHVIQGENNINPNDRQITRQADRIHSMFWRGLASSQNVCKGYSYTLASCRVGVKFYNHTFWLQYGCIPMQYFPLSLLLKWEHSSKINARQQLVVLYKGLSVRTHWTDPCQSALTQSKLKYLSRNALSFNQGLILTMLAWLHYRKLSDQWNYSPV